MKRWQAILLAVVTTIGLASCSDGPSCDGSAKVRTALVAAGFVDACIRATAVNGDEARYVTVEWADPDSDIDANVAHAKALRDVVYRLWPQTVSSLTVHLDVGDSEASVPTLDFGGNVSMP